MHCTEFSRLPSKERLTKSSITVRNAVRVLPEPVGEHSSKCSPSIIFGIATFCGCVKSGNLSLNQLRTGGHNLSRSLSDSIMSCTYSIFGI